MESGVYRQGSFSRDGISRVVCRTSSEVAALAQFKEALEEMQATPRTPQKSARLAGPARQAAAARRRQRSLLARLLMVALLVAALTGSASYRMHMAVRREQAAEGFDEALALASRGGPLSGLRSWLSGAQGASRRSLRERPPAAAGLVAGAAETLAAGGGPRRHAGVQGVLLYDHWWLLGGPTTTAAAAAAAQQQQQMGEEGASGAGEGSVDSSPLHGLIRERRLRPAAVHVFDFASRAWVPHNLTRFPPEVPAERWAVASLMNKAKKKESAIFLLGGFMSAAEAAAARGPRPPSVGSAGSASPATPACPLASTGAYALNVGRGKVRPLAQLPAGRYGGSAVVAGARLHYLGGWATPDRASRVAEATATHWSVGLNADGSSAPEWQEEEPLPEGLVGRRLTAVTLSPEANGEPAVFVWASSSSDAGGDEIAPAKCFAGGAAPGGGSSQQQPVQMWSFASSTGWQRHSFLPQPLADDVQCAVAASSHQLMAVGAVERSGIFTQQRGLWQFDAANGGTWSRAGWAPPEFAGHLCALHRSRLFVSTALPPEPTAAEDEAAAEEGGDAAALAVTA